MKEKSSPSTTLRLYFAGIAEQTFQVQLGIADPQVVDYLSDLLMRFVRQDSFHRVRNLRGRPVQDMSELLSEADQRVGLARREVYRHIGDFALFWAGLYPESLRPRPGKPIEQDRYGDYCEHGRRSYLLASTIETDEDKDVPNAVLERIGMHFEMCAYGLREVRREWERN